MMQQARRHPASSPSARKREARLSTPFASRLEKAVYKGSESEDSASRKPQRRLKGRRGLQGEVCKRSARHRTQRRKHAPG